MSTIEIRVSHDSVAFVNVRAVDVEFVLPAVVAVVTVAYAPPRNLTESNVETIPIVGPGRTAGRKVIPWCTRRCCGLRSYLPLNHS